MDAEPLRQRIERFLREHHVASLATTDGESAHAACVMYALEDLDLVWTSDPQSRHSRQSAERRRISATIAPDYTDFRQIRGVQIAGLAEHLSDAAEIARARALLVARYPFLRDLDAGPPKLRIAFQTSGFYRLRPSRITLIDNTREFGYRETLELAHAGRA